MTLAIAEAPVVATQEIAPVPLEFEDESVRIVHHKFTVDDYYRMLEIGVLAEDDRVELIDGEVREMCPIDPVHAANIDRLNRLLSRRINEQTIIRVQNPIRLHDNTEPIPDLTLVRWQDDFYEHHHPLPADVLILIEVANTSLAYDRKEKLPRYAAAGIPEVWLINIARQTIEQYTTPANGQYTERVVLNRGQTLTPKAIDGIELTVDQIFGQKSS